MTIKQQAEKYLLQIATRRRNPVSISTLASYNSCLNKWIIPVLGGQELEETGNSSGKLLASRMAEAGLKPATISFAINLLKEVVESNKDINGNPVHQIRWDSDYMDLPLIRSQKQPIIDQKTLQEAIRRADTQDAALYTILASTGLRIGELMALRPYTQDGQGTFWCPDRAIIHVGATIARSQYQSHPKTEAGNRDIDLHPQVNEYLKKFAPLQGWMFRAKRNESQPLSMTTASLHLNKNGIKEGFHSFRRFRITHLRVSQVPEDLIRYWVGHGDRTITDRYVNINEGVRKQWAEKAGIGFSI